MNAIISIAEGLLITRFTSMTSINKDRSTTFLIIYAIIQSLLSYSAFYFNLDSVISTVIIVSCYVIFSYKGTFASLANSAFLGFTLNLLILIANGSTILISYAIRFISNIEIPYSVMLIISKILLLLLVEISGRMIQNHAYYTNSKISLFNLSILLLTSLYSLLFDGFFKSSIKTHYFLANVIIFSLLVIVIYKLFDNQKQSIIAQANHRLLQNEIEFLKKNYKNLISNENETRKMRHNNKHFLLLLKEYSKAKDLENIEKALNNELDNLDNLKYSINTGNESINLIISHYLTLIRDKKIDLICNFCEEQPNIDKLDFYIIFGNILENAIEHCESDKVKKITIENESAWQFEKNATERSFEYKDFFCTWKRPFDFINLVNKRKLDITEYRKLKKLIPNAEYDREQVFVIKERLKGYILRAFLRFYPVKYQYAFHKFFTKPIDI